MERLFGVNNIVGSIYLICIILQLIEVVVTSHSAVLPSSQLPHAPPNYTIFKLHGAQQRTAKFSNGVHSHRLGFRELNRAITPMIGP